MRVSEIFHSIQGEGNFIGEPCTFVRFSGCNLVCPGCDTKYHTEGVEMTAEEVVNQIKELDKGSKVVVFSGGEPLLQQKAIIEIIKLLNPRSGRGVGWMDWFFQIETNGTICPTELLDWSHLGENKYVAIQYNVSPKLGSFNIDGNNIDALKTLHTWGSYIIKPVITTEADIVELQGLQKKFGWRNTDIYLMPEGATKPEQEVSMPIIADLAIRYNYRMTPRLHTLIWGNVKGK